MEEDANFKLLREYINSKIIPNDVEFNKWVLIKSINILGDAFNEFLEKTMDGQQPKAPSMKDIAKARGYLPPHCPLSYYKGLL